LVPWTQRFLGRVDVIPTKGQYLVPPRTCERSHGYDGEQRRPFETLYQRPQLIGLKGHTVIGFARGGDLS
jgi:hypothetical protein